MDSGLLDLPELKIPQVFELDDMFGFCQDISDFKRHDFCCIIHL